MLLILVLLTAHVCGCISQSACEINNQCWFIADYRGVKVPTHLKDYPIERPLDMLTIKGFLKDYTNSFYFIRLYDRGPGELNKTEILSLYFSVGPPKKYFLIQNRKVIWHQNIPFTLPLLLELQMTTSGETLSIILNKILLESHLQDHQLTLRNSRFLRVSTNVFQNINLDYLTGCSDVMKQPIICPGDDNLPSSPFNFVMNETYTLSCQASGAPFLAVEWLKNGRKIKMVSRVVKTYINESESTHVLTSTFSITRLNETHLGQYSCIIRNKRFGDPVTKNFTVDYKRKNIISYPNNTYFDDSSVRYIWKIRGYPVSDFILECQPNKNISRHFGSLTKPLLLVLNIYKESHLSCTLKDKQLTYETRTFIRCPGRSTFKNSKCFCPNGNFMKYDKCFPCPDGQYLYSESGNNNVCYNHTSSCQSNYYGYANNCTVCPIGRLSPRNSTNSSDCYREQGQCKEGKFGTSSDGCQSCPFGEISNQRTAVKVEDCFKAKNADCDINNYGYRNRQNCKICPHGLISDKGAVKAEECKPSETSPCKIGEYYNHQNRQCFKCPNKTTSSEGAAKVQDCVCKDGYSSAPDLKLICNPCPQGMYSNINKDTRCFNVNNNCTDGYYGIGQKCKPCPFGTTSSKKKNAKPEDCYKVESTCKMNYYLDVTRTPTESQDDSSPNITCKLCPFGYVSLKGAVKIKDCFNNTKPCQVGINCISCPKYSTGNVVKIEDCECMAGYFRDSSVCTQCPENHSSNQGSRTKERCVQLDKTDNKSSESETSSKMMISIAAGSGCLIIAVLVIGGIVTRKYYLKLHAIAAPAPIKLRFSSLEISNPVINYHINRSDESEATYSTLLKTKTNLPREPIPAHNLEDTYSRLVTSSNIPVKSYKQKGENSNYDKEESLCLDVIVESKDNSKTVISLEDTKPKLKVSHDEDATYAELEFVPVVKRVKSGRFEAAEEEPCYLTINSVRPSCDVNTEQADKYTYSNV